MGDPSGGSLLREVGNQGLPFYRGAAGDVGEGLVAKGAGAVLELEVVEGAVHGLASL
jgi:hypothetical protein